MLTEAHQKEDLGRAYVQAVAAAAGVTVDMNSRNHDYGIDGSFRQIAKFRGKLAENGYTIDFQLKSTKNLKMDDEFVTYSLNVDHYNSLASRKKIPRAKLAVLIVFRMPEDPKMWIEQSENDMILRHCCYWVQIMPPLSANRSTVDVRIPRNQLFTPDAIQEWFQKLKKRKTNLTSNLLEVQSRTYDQ